MRDLLKLVLAAEIFCSNVCLAAELPKKFIEGYEKNRGHIASAVKVHNLKKYSGNYNPYALIAAVISQESSWDEKARRYEDEINDSSYGLTQIIPTYHPKFNKKKLMKNPSYNIHAGAEILRNCLKRSNGNVELALKKYNGSSAYANRVLRYYKKFAYMKK